MLLPVSKDLKRFLRCQSMLRRRTLEVPLTYTIVTSLTLKQQTRLFWICSGRNNTIFYFKVNTATLLTDSNQALSSTDQPNFDLSIVDLFRPSPRRHNLGVPVLKMSHPFSKVSTFIRKLQRNNNPTSSSRSPSRSSYWSTIDLSSFSSRSRLRNNRKRGCSRKNKLPALSPNLTRSIAALLSESLPGLCARK